MEYSVLEHSNALKLLKEQEAREIRVIDYNYATVYKLTDTSFLVKPLNPFSNCLLSDSSIQIKNFEKNGYFPDGDEQKTLYSENRLLFENESFFKIKTDKIQELTDYFGKSNSKYVKDLRLDDFDSIYVALNKTKMYGRYKLGLCFLIGDHLLKIKAGHFKWGIVQEKLYLNPYRHFVLINSKSGAYFSLENNLLGKWGYPGMQALLHSFERFGLSLEPPLIEYYREF